VAKKALADKLELDAAEKVENDKKI